MTQEKFDKVRELIASGVMVKDACQKVGCIKSTYYSHLNRFRAALEKKENTIAPKKSRETYQAIPIVRSSGFELKGSPEEIARFVKELSKHE